MSKLKKHIRNHRQEFEIYQTDTDSLWEEISLGLDQRSRQRQPWLKVAATLVVIMLVGFVGLRFATNAQKFKDGISLSEISPELAEAEFYYSRLVEEKFAMIHASNSSLDPVIQKEIQGLDSAYVDLKNDLKDNMDNEEVINAMIQNYRIKLQILEQILENIEMSNEEKDTNEEGYSI